MMVLCWVADYLYFSEKTEITENYDDGIFFPVSGKKKVIVSFFVTGAYFFK